MNYKEAKKIIEENPKLYSTLDDRYYDSDSIEISLIENKDIAIIDLYKNKAKEMSVVITIQGMISEAKEMNLTILK